MSGDEFRGRSESTAPQDPDDSAEREGEAQAGDETGEAWDAHDPRRRDDQFAPPSEPCECWCLHCRRVFVSDGIWFQRVVNDPAGFPGFWKCPTPNCDGAGFTFDIFPTNPEHPANAGWSYDDGDEEGEDWDADDAGSADGQWDPDESKYKELDETLGDDGDLEGEEWKYGLEPGQRPADPDWMEQARLEHEEEERRYDQPDERPQVLDWSDRKDRVTPPGLLGEDDIPF